MNQPIQTNKKGISSPSTMVLLNWFSNALGHLKFKYGHPNYKWIDVDSIIAIVTLTYNANSKKISLDQEDVASLNDFVVARK